MKVQWLDRSLMQCSYYYALCLDEKAFQAELKKMNVPPDGRPSFMKNGSANATCHFFDSDDGKRSAIICMHRPEGRTGVEIAGLLVHEAVHIWQAHCDDIGETAPASEQEAYAIQSIAQSLMQAYADAING